MSKPLQIIDENINAVRIDFDKVSIDKNIKFATEAQFAMQAMQANTYLMSVAMNSLETLKAAIINISAIGISLNPALKQAYLVPRDKKVCLDISYMGMLQLAQLTGSILWGQAAIVRKTDDFKRQGIDKAPTHSFNDFDTEDERGEIVGVYCVVKLPNGDYLTHTMRIADVFAIRDKSTGWKAHIKEGKASPWASSEEEMIKKTCIKQAYKTWPKNERLSKAIDYLNTDGEEGTDFEEKQNSFLTGSHDNPDRQSIIDRAEIEAEKGIDSFTEFYKNGISKEQRAIVGNNEWKRLGEKAKLISSNTVYHEDGANGTPENG